LHDQDKIEDNGKWERRRKGQRLNQGKERGLKGKWENWADFGCNLAGSKQRCLQRS